MSKQVTVQQNRFDGGISDSPRSSVTNDCITCKHFDIHTDRSKLIPYRSFEIDTNDGSTSTGMKQYNVLDFILHSTSTKLFGLGKVVATGFTKIVYKATALSGNWTLPASSEGNGARVPGCFVEYKGFMWGFQGTTQVFKWDTASFTITNTAGTVGTINSVAQGLIAKDDQLYLPYNNKLARVSSGGTVTDAVLTLPTNLEITSLANYGNYIAIACRPYRVVNNLGYGGNSKVFFWNLTSPDVQETIDWGEGDLNVLDTVDGTLVGVTDYYTANSLSNGSGSIIIKALSGNYPINVKLVTDYLATDGAGSVLSKYKSVKNNRLFFSATVSYNVQASAAYSTGAGLYSYGRKDNTRNYALSLDYVNETLTTISTFNIVGNVVFVSQSTDGSIEKTNDAETYTYTSIFETNILNFTDVFSDKRLENIKLSFRKLITGESITLKYQVDAGDGGVGGLQSWTTIGTYNTVGGISHTFVREEATPKDFTSGKEFKFRIESTGGAEITGWSATATVLNNV